MLTGHGKTNALKAMLLAHGLNGQSIAALAQSERLMVAEHLVHVGFAGAEEYEEACHSRLALAKLLRLYWPAYLKNFVGLYPETDQTV